MNVTMVSGVGDDELGAKAIDALRSHGVSTTFVQTKANPTGQVFVNLDSQGRASYEFASNTAWDNLSWSEELDSHAKQMDAICFGTLGQRSEESREIIQRFVTSARADCLRVFDINLRPPFFEEASILESLRLANVLKMSDEELPMLQKLCGCNGSDVDVMNDLARRFELIVVALTRGPDGATLIREGEKSIQSGVPCKLVDTVGAGDAFTAALVLGLLNGQDLDEINKSACEVASFVCSQSGATPVLPDRFSF